MEKTQDRAIKAILDPESPCSKVWKPIDIISVRLEIRFLQPLPCLVAKTSTSNYSNRENISLLFSVVEIREVCVPQTRL